MRHTKYKGKRKRTLTCSFLRVTGIVMASGILFYGGVRGIQYNTNTGTSEPNTTTITPLKIPPEVNSRTTHEKPKISDKEDANDPLFVNVYEEPCYTGLRNLDEVGASTASYTFGVLTGEKYNEANQSLLLKIAMAEAEGEGIEGKAHVLRVILNRIASEQFPDTVREVIYEPKQFQPASESNWPEIVPDKECQQALDLIILDGWDNTQGALYFEATYNGTDTCHTRNLDYLFTYGGHNFYK